MITPDLPAALRAALEARLQGVSRNEAAARAAAISKTYRDGGGSTAITGETDALAYALARMPATYAAVGAALRHLIEALSIDGPDRDELERMSTPLPRERLATTFGDAHAQSRSPSQRQTLTDLLRETSGAIVLSGPAGSGKTTTIYACLRELAANSSGTRSLVTLEDPIEVPVEGVSQSQVNVAAGFDLPTGLRSLLR